MSKFGKNCTNPGLDSGYSVFCKALFHELIMEIQLCPLKDLEIDGSQEFNLTVLDRDIELFAVIKHGKVYAYLNQCPHTGVTLNWQPNQFFDIENCYIQCSTHGALFRIEDGYCIRGPCAGQRLTQLEIATHNDCVFLLPPSHV